MERKVILLIGGTGCGKSKWAYDNYPDLYDKSKEKWWDGYTNQGTVLFDDCGYPMNDYREMLKLMDRYPLRHREIKSLTGGVDLRYSTVIFTANHGPDRWWPTLDRQALLPFWRRITTTIFWDQDGSAKEEAWDNMTADDKANYYHDFIF